MANTARLRQLKLENFCIKVLSSLSPNLCIASHKKHPCNLFIVAQSKGNRFSKFFHCQISKEILYVSITKISTSPETHFTTTTL